MNIHHIEAIIIVSMVLPHTYLPWIWIGRNVFNGRRIMAGFLWITVTLDTYPKL